MLLLCFQAVNHCPVFIVEERENLSREVSYISASSFISDLTECVMWEYLSEGISYAPLMSILIWFLIKEKESRIHILRFHYFLAFLLFILLSNLLTIENTLLVYSTLKLVFFLHVLFYSSNFIIFSYNILHKLVCQYCGNGPWNKVSRKYGFLYSVQKFRCSSIFCHCLDKVNEFLKDYHFFHPPLFSRAQKKIQKYL